MEFRKNRILQTDISVFFSEKRWFRCNKALGVLLLDNDFEYAYVVLVKHEGIEFRGVDMEVSILSEEAAVDRLKHKLLQYNDQEETTSGPTIALEDMPAIFAETTGTTVEHARKVMESLKTPWDSKGKA